MTPTPDQARYLYRRLEHERWLKAAVELADAIERRGIPVVVLKGPVLAERIYEDPGGRGYSDVDLMVRRRDAVEAGRALEELGYALSLGGLSEAENQRLEFNTLYVRAGAPPVEIAFRVTDMPGAALESEAFVARRQPYRTRTGALVHTLDPEDEFIFLCTHGSRHHFEEEKWLTDLRLFLVRYPELRWDVVCARARELRLQTAVWVACQNLRANPEATVSRDAGPHPPVEQASWPATTGVLAGGAEAKASAVVTRQSQPQPQAAPPRPPVPELRVTPSWLMRSTWPGIVPVVSSFECYKRLDWGVRDALYEAALCDGIPDALYYLARRAFRFARREVKRRFK